MVLKLKIISIGKTKEEWLNEAIEEYVKRLSPILKFEFVWAKNNDQLKDLVEKESRVICLDAAGQMFDSEKFADFILKEFVEGKSRLTLVIGGAEGLPQEFKTRYRCISLSPLTMTHQIVRLVLIEQIYRAFEISKGTKYHK